VILKADWVVTAASEPIRDGAVAVEGDRIADVGRSAEVIGRFPSAELRDFGRAAIIPGFVNTHSHLDYTAWRGFMDDLSFFRWVFTLGRTSGAGLSFDSFYFSALLGAAECIRSGITTLADTTASGASFRVIRESGLRGIAYREVFDVRGSAASALSRLKAEVDEMLGRATGRVGVGVSPHSPYTVSSRLLRDVKGFADRMGLPICIHLAETRSEVGRLRGGSWRGRLATRCVGVKIDRFGLGPAGYLDSLGVLEGGALLVHCVHLGDADIELLSERGCAVAHCPRSNAKLAVGIAPLGSFISKGLRVGFGTDSAASSNTLDMFEEMRFAVLIHRASSMEVGALDAEAAFRMATVGGADALGLGDEVGSIEVGKKADLAVVDLSSGRFVPEASPYSMLVYSACAEDIIFTMVDGRTLFDGGRFTELDIGRVRSEGMKVGRKIRHGYGWPFS